MSSYSPIIHSQLSMVTGKLLNEVLTPPCSPLSKTLSFFKKFDFWGLGTSVRQAYCMLLPFKGFGCFFWLFKHR